MSAVTTSRRCRARHPATAASRPRRSVAATATRSPSMCTAGSGPATSAASGVGAGGTSPVSRVRRTRFTRSATSRPFHADQAPGPVAAASARVSPYSRSSVVTSPTAVATLRMVTGSARSRRVATSGSSRCSRTSLPTSATSGAGSPMQAAIAEATWAPATLWSPGSPLPTSCRNAASTSRSGRATSRAYAAASAAACTRCRSTVYRCTGLYCGSPRSRIHSGIHPLTSPYRSHASQTGISAGPAPSRVSSAPGVVDRVRHRPGVLGDPAQQGVPVGQFEQAGDLVPLLRDEPVHPPAGRDVQGVPDVEQPDMCRPYLRPPRVGDPGHPDSAQDADVAQAAAGLLDVALQEKRQLSVRLPTRGNHLVQRRQGGGGTAPPLFHRRRAYLTGQRRVAGEVPEVEQPQRDLHVLPGDGERLVDGAYRVVQADPGVPDRVPDRLGERRHVGPPVVQQDEVHVAVRGALPPAQPADGHEGHARYRGHQAGQPSVERRRTLFACGGADAFLVDGGAVGQSASNPRSPVRTRITSSTGVTQTLPSPIFPVRAAVTMASTIFSTSISSVTTSTRILGKNSTVYSAPRSTSVWPFCRPYPCTSLTVRPATPRACSA